ncbi:MAG: hypothetical protein WDN48_19950 [Pseudolabrys sp.]
MPLSETVVPGYDKFPANDKSPLWITINHNVIAIAWNTNLVKGSDVPKGYEDLADNPAFAQKGSVVYADPRATPNAMSLFKILVDKYGEGYFKKLRDRGLAISAAGPAGAQQIAAGAAKVMVGIMSNNAQTVMPPALPLHTCPFQTQQPVRRIASRCRVARSIRMLRDSMRHGGSVRKVSA